MPEIYNEKDEIDEINIDKLKKKGVCLSNRDTTEEIDYKNNRSIFKINFTGFEIDNKGEVVYFFPYQYKVHSLKHDAVTLFKTIYMHIQQRPELYFGEKKDSFLKSNFPFESFFEIFEYYKENGLYVEYYDQVLNRHTSKVNWKFTISNSEKYIIDDSIYFQTLYYRNTFERENFITDCMSFIIEYTLSTFSFIFGVNSLGLKYKDWKFLENREFVIRKLTLLNTRIFNSKGKKLLNAIIRFFKENKFGGNYYLKHYNFDSIWEDLVQHYLNNKFNGISKGMIDLEGSFTGNRFKKIPYHPNLNNANHSIQPDNILIENGKTYIFDAKYFLPTGIDYKQVCYSIFLARNISDLKNIYSALIVPGEERKKIEYFIMDPDLNKDLSDLKISMEFLDIRKVMEFYIN